MKFRTATLVFISLVIAAALSDHSPRARAATTGSGCADSCDLAAHKATIPQTVPMQGMVADMPGMAGMPSAGKATPAPSPPGDAQMGPSQAMGSMSMAVMQGHMQMTGARPASAADRARADAIVSALRAAVEPFKDYRVAEAAGYKPFHPEWPLPMYHFTNWQNALANEFSFDPARPTSLMYKRVPGGFTLEGAMYTAPRGLTPDQLDTRVPLSIATWHEHTNLCMPPPGMVAQAFGPNARYGLQGSITTADACAQAGGTFKPVIYNWMVHVWPYETDPTRVWATEDNPGSMGH